MIHPETLIQSVLQCGARAAAALSVSEIPFNRAFRDACVTNTCGNYGKCWACPPDAGDIDDLIAQAKRFENAIIYQTVGTLEDSFDIEGMLEAGVVHNHVAQRIADEILPAIGGRTLQLGAGGCKVCETCAKREDLPCRYPARALRSMETYGVAVSETAALCGLNYINGQNTVTYFGMILYGVRPGV